MCDSYRKSARDYEAEFDGLCKILFKQKQRVNKQVVDLVKKILWSMSELEHTLDVPTVKLAVMQAEQLERLQDQINGLRRHDPTDPQTEAD